ncbi:catalase [Aureivirga marina]|uniref:catalase n=1 Tax=Aureivirga marina TaxID=1182451 RepID=UPI0018C9DC2D|nr:catalase [Aureivirga marina]
MSNRRFITNETGIPVKFYEDSESVGERGPLLIQDYFLFEKMAHFNRERIPERVVHAKGSGAYGTLTITHDITKYTKAKIFGEVGKQTKAFLRFSTVGGELGSADAERDPRGFAIKFYTEEGIWDLVGNNTPVFFIKDPKKFSDFIHTQKRDPRTNCKSPTMMWDFWSWNPESLHQVMILMSDRGIPKSHRFMNGYGSHTFSFINDKEELVFVKFHFKTAQGIENLTAEEAAQVKSQDMDHAQRDLVEAIDRGDFPKWNMKIQIMTEKEAEEFQWNPFDLTKVWPHGDFPLIDVGVLELNEIPDNFFAHVEQAAFSPSNVIPGIGFSPDKMLQGRIFSYPDAHRYRLGVNHNSLPVNKCPFAVNNYHKDGLMRFDDNRGSSPNYYPNSFDNSEPYDGIDLNNCPHQPKDKRIGTFDRNHNDDDHYSQPGKLFEIMPEDAKQRTIKNISDSMKGITGIKKEEIINRQLCHFFRANVTLGMGIARELGVSIDMDKMKM